MDRQIELSIAPTKGQLPTSSGSAVVPSPPTPLSPLLPSLTLPCCCCLHGALPAARSRLASASAPGGGERLQPGPRDQQRVGDEEHALGVHGGQLALGNRGLALRRGGAGRVCAELHRDSLPVGDCDSPFMGGNQGNRTRQAHWDTRGDTGRTAISSDISRHWQLSPPSLTTYRGVHLDILRRHVGKVSNRIVPQVIGRRHPEHPLASLQDIPARRLDPREVCANFDNC